MNHYDLTVFGATSFVGKLLAAYLADNAPARITIALAGRNRAKLEALRAELPGAAGTWPIDVYDALDSEDMARLARSSRVVVSTVGPYDVYGRELVQACAHAGTHYLDLAGEAVFVRRSALSLHAIAERSGAAIVHSCGFDSVPSDLALFRLFTQQGHVNDSRMVVNKLKGGASGGTIASMLHHFRTLSELSAEERAACSSALALAPGERSDRDLPATGMTGALAPFVMAGYNTKLVRRSAQLLGYGPVFDYREYVATPTVLSAAVRTAQSAAFAAAINSAVGRKILERILPAPGEGPSPEARAQGCFSTTTTDLATGNSVTVALDKDPGYEGTALMLGEAALVLADPDGAPLRTGVLTPASALGEAYVKRLRRAGMLID